MAEARVSVGHAERRRRWAALVSEWRDSALSQTAFCRERGLSVRSFYCWRRRMLRQQPEANRAGASEFIPVRVAAPVSCAVEVCLRSGHTIRIAADFDETVLRRLIGVLEAGRAC